MSDIYAEHWTKVAAELPVEGLAALALEYSKGDKPWKKELANFLRRALVVRLPGGLCPMTVGSGGKS